MRVQQAKSDKEQHEYMKKKIIVKEKFKKQSKEKVCVLFKAKI